MHKTPSALNGKQTRTHEAQSQESLTRDQELLVNFFKRLDHPLKELWAMGLDLRWLLDQTMSKLVDPIETSDTALKSPPVNTEGKSNTNPEMLSKRFTALLNENPTPWKDERLILEGNHINIRLQEEQNLDYVSPVCVKDFALYVGEVWLAGLRLQYNEQEQQWNVVKLDLGVDSFYDVEDEFFYDEAALVNEQKETVRTALERVYGQTPLHIRCMLALGSQAYDEKTGGVQSQRMSLSSSWCKEWAKEDVLCWGAEQSDANAIPTYSVELESIGTQIWPAPDHPEVHKASWNLSNGVSILYIDDEHDGADLTERRKQERICFGARPVTIEDWARAQPIRYSGVGPDFFGKLSLKGQKAIEALLYADSLVWVSINQSPPKLLVKENRYTEHFIQLCQEMVELRDLQKGVKGVAPIQLNNTTPTRPVKRKL